MDPLRNRLERIDETLQEFDAAARQRHLEGLELMLAGSFGAGIYLMGYAAEMLLKIACFRIDGAGPADPIEPCLVQARQWKKKYFPNVDFENYHSLWCWCQLLLQKRVRKGRALSDPIASKLVSFVQELYATWWIEMRYRSDQALAVEAQTVYNDVTWIFDNHLLLWR